MVKRLCLLLGLLCLAFAVGARAPAAATDFEARAPWAAGEETRYDVLASNGSIVATDHHALERSSTGWLLRSKRTGSGAHEGEIRMDGALAPIASWRTRNDERAEATYDAGQVRIRTKKKQSIESEETLSLFTTGVDNDAALFFQRSLPFAKDAHFAYENVSPSAKAVVPARVHVVGKEPIAVAAGTFESWHVVTRFGAARHDAWYGVDPPHLLLRYENKSTGKSIELRAYKLNDGAAWKGESSKPSVTAVGSVPMSYGLVAIMLLVQLPLMIFFPLLLAYWIGRRTKGGMKALATGASAFIASQVLHLPFNWAIGLIGGSRGAGLLSLPLLALVAGLSAGIFEELARYVAMRFVLKPKGPSFRPALAYGVGHGGIEAMIVGFLVLVSVGVMVTFSVSPSVLDLSGPSLEIMQEQSDAFWSTAWHLPIAGGLERVFAIAAHVAMSVLVMRAVVRKNTAYLFAAILAHTLLDAWAVWASQSLGTWWTEAGIALFGAGFAGLIWLLRESPTGDAPGQAATVSPPSPAAVAPAPQA